MATETPTAKKQAKDHGSGSGATSKKTKRSYLPAEERRESILKAAQEVFSRSNLQGARTRDLAKAAGVNPATLYWHFESKEEIFAEAVVQPLLDAMKGMYERVASYQRAATREEFMATANASSLHHLESIVEIYPLLATALFSDPEMGKKIYCEHIAPIFAERGKAMREVIRDDIDANLFSLLAFGMFLAVAMDRFFTGKDGDLAELAEQIVKLSTFGFARDRYRD